MLNLASTSDKIQVVTSAAVDVDVHASYMDYDGSAVTPGRKNTKITTATTTDVVLAPATSTTRNVKELQFANVHASTANTLTIEHTDGTNVVRKKKVTLETGEILSYVEGVGWRVFDSAGREKIVGAVAVYNCSVTDQGPGFASDTYLTGSNIAIGGRLKVGTIMRWKVACTKTAAGSATPIWIVRFGTAGAIGDTARCTMTCPAQSGASDTAVWELFAAVRAIGASGVVSAAVGCMHALDSTGFSVGNGAASVTSGAFDTTVVGLQAGVSVNGGSSASWTVQQVNAEAFNLAA
jgi:hypothetical protein